MQQHHRDIPGLINNIPLYFASPVQANPDGFFVPANLKRAALPDLIPASHKNPIMGPGGYPFSYPPVDNKATLKLSVDEGTRNTYPLLQPPFDLSRQLQTALLKPKVMPFPGIADNEMVQKLAQLQNVFNDPKQTQQYFQNSGTEYDDDKGVADDIGRGSEERRERFLLSLAALHRQQQQQQFYLQQQQQQQQSLLLSSLMYSHTNPNYFYPPLLPPHHPYFFNPPTRPPLPVSSPAKTDNPFHLPPHPFFAIPPFAPPLFSSPTASQYIMKSQDNEFTYNGDCSLINNPNRIQMDYSPNQTSSALDKCHALDLSLPQLKNDQSMHHGIDSYLNYARKILTLPPLPMSDASEKVSRLITPESQQAQRSFDLRQQPCTKSLSSLDNKRAKPKQVHQLPPNFRSSAFFPSNVSSFSSSRGLKVNNLINPSAGIKNPINNAFNLGKPNISTKKLPLPMEENRFSTYKSSIIAEIQRLDNAIDASENRILALNKAKVEMSEEINSRFAKLSRSTVHRSLGVKETSLQEMRTESLIINGYSLIQGVLSDNQKLSQDRHDKISSYHLSPSSSTSDGESKTNHTSLTPLTNLNAIGPRFESKNPLVKKMIGQYLTKKRQDDYMQSLKYDETYQEKWDAWNESITKFKKIAKRRNKDSKAREFFENQYPELRDDRLEKERLNRIWTRNTMGNYARTETDLEEITKRLHEQEEEKRRLFNLSAQIPRLLSSIDKVWESRMVYLDPLRFILTCNHHAKTDIKIETILGHELDKKDIANGMVIKNLKLEIENIPLSDCKFNQRDEIISNPLMAEKEALTQGDKFRGCLCFDYDVNISVRDMEINQGTLLPLEERGVRFAHYNIWTLEERETFKKCYTSNPKEFETIALSLPNKSVSDCVLFYYLTKKGENYKKLVRRKIAKRRKIAANNINSNGKPQNPQTPSKNVDDLVNLSMDDNSQCHLNNSTCEELNETLQANRLDRVIENIQIKEVVLNSDKLEVDKYDGQLNASFKEMDHLIKSEINVSLIKHEIPSNTAHLARPRSAQTTQKVFTPGLDKDPYEFRPELPFDQLNKTYSTHSYHVTSRPSKRFASPPLPISSLPHRDANPFNESFFPSLQHSTEKRLKLNRHIGSSENKIDTLTFHQERENFVLKTMPTNVEIKTPFTIFSTFSANDSGTDQNNKAIDAFLSALPKDAYETSSSALNSQNNPGLAYLDNSSDRDRTVAILDAVIAHQINQNVRDAESIELWNPLKHCSRTI
ncbi:unnamed protein product [Gordionus sp. m RMFG-2023]|uniref:uncharacterized protein LOC135931506 isoform X2 n=1 Tax=Gordionus sp. m RMFG-2023 TaxID=3053472 RepID=UPI0030E09C69